MKTLVKWLFVGFTGLYLAGCASVLTVEQSSPEVNLSPELKALSVAVVDSRPYVVNKDKSPAFEGIIRSGLGIPYSYNTPTQEPMAVYLGNRISHGIRKNGVEVSVYSTTAGMPLKEVFENVASYGKTAVVINLNEWKYDSHPFSDSSWYDMDVYVIDKNAEQLAYKKFSGEEDIPGSGIVNEMLLLYKNRFEQVFSDPEIRNALSH